MCVWGWKHWERVETLKWNIVIHAVTLDSILKRLNVAHNPHNILKMYYDADRLDFQPSCRFSGFVLWFHLLCTSACKPISRNTGMDQCVKVYCSVSFSHCRSSSFHNQTCFFVFSFFPDLNHIPSDLPSDIVKMDLSRNTIKHLRPKQFLLSKDLKLLNLSSNSLHRIDTGGYPPKPLTNSLPSTYGHFSTLCHDLTWRYLSLIGWQVFIKTI